MVRAAGTIGAATLLSRILGYVRDMVIAWYFGAGMNTDAFIAAFRIPNLLRRLFGEGTLSATFIPVFTETLSRQGRAEAFAMARSAMRLWALALLAAALSCWALAPQMMHFLAYGFSFDPDKFRLTVNLSRIMAPYIFFIGLVAFCMGVLNSLGHFAGPALAPVVLNVTMIASVLFLTPLMPEAVDPITALAVGVILGGVLQLGLQVPLVTRRGVFARRQAPLIHPGVKKAGRLMLPTVFGSAVYQINILSITVFASLQPQGSLSCLYFADRLIQFPLGLFGVSIATAVLPSLSRQAAADDLAALKSTVSHALRLVLFITLPAMAGLIVLRAPIIRLLFQRGAFDARAAELTADVLLYYAIGLGAVASVRIVVQTFYALQDTRTPVKAAVISIAANLVFMRCLTGPMGPGGLALAISLASGLNLLLLVGSLRGRLGRLGGLAILVSTVKSVFCTLFMTAVVWALARWIVPAGPGDFIGLLIGVTGCIAAGTVAYTAAAALIRCTELGILWGLIRKKEHST